MRKFNRKRKEQQETKKEPFYMNQRSDGRVESGWYDTAAGVVDPETPETPTTNTEEYQMETVNKSEADTQVESCEQKPEEVRGGCRLTMMPSWGRNDWKLLPCHVGWQKCLYDYRNVIFYHFYLKSAWT